MRHAALSFRWIVIQLWKYQNILYRFESISIWEKFSKKGFRLMMMKYTGMGPGAK